MDFIFNKVDIFRKKMFNVKYEEEKNIFDIECKVDEEVVEVEKLVKYVEDLKK